MNSKIEQSKDASTSGGDLFKYVAASVLVLAGLFVWFWFSADSGRAAALGNWSGQIRALAVILGLAGGVAVFMLTSKGHQTRGFLAESRFELRKVVWPTRQEATRMTWVVIVVVIVLSLLLGGFDFLIQKAVQLFLGR